MNARGIPTVVYQVFHLLSYTGGLEGTTYGGRGYVSLLEAVPHLDGGFPPSSLGQQVPPSSLGWWIPPSSLGYGRGKLHLDREVPLSCLDLEGVRPYSDLARVPTSRAGWCTLLSWNGGYPPPSKA